MLVPDVPAESLGEGLFETISADSRDAGLCGHRAPADGSGWDTEVRAEAIGEMAVIDKAP